MRYLKKRYILPLLLMLLMQFSCNTDNNLIEQQDDLTLLTSGKWQRVSIKSTSGSSVMLLCESDDVYEFDEANNCTIDNGSIFCNASLEKLMTGTWSYKAETNYLRLEVQGFLYEFTLKTITETELVLEHTANGNIVRSYFELN